MNTAQLRLTKALAGELTGVSIDLLKLKVEEAKKVTLILSSEDHMKRGSTVPRRVEEAHAKGWIASDIVLIK